MIEGFSCLPRYLEEYIIELYNSDIKFYLTGSRYFGGADKYSDWDFFTEYDNKTEEYLKDLGFKVNESIQCYTDPMTTKIMTLEIREAVVHGLFEDDIVQGIDVQLCHDIKNKLKIRDIIKNVLGGKVLGGDKRQKSLLWNNIYKLITDS